MLLKHEHTRIPVSAIELRERVQHADKQVSGYGWVPVAPLAALLTPRTPLMWSPMDGPTEPSECTGLGGASGAGRFSGSVSRGDPGCMVPPPLPPAAPPRPTVGDDDCKASTQESQLPRPPLVRRLPER